MVALTSEGLAFGIGSNNKLLFSGIVFTTDKVTAPFPDVNVVFEAVIAVKPST